MLEGIPLAVLNGMGFMGGTAFVFYMVATGKAATPREIKEKNAEIKFLRERNAELSAQNLTLIREQSTVVQVLGTMRDVAGGGE